MCNFSTKKYFVRPLRSDLNGLNGRNISMGWFSRLISQSLGVIFNSSVGDALENILKKYQKNRVMKNPLTGQPGGRVVCTDLELEFHPHSFEGTIVEKYNRGLEKLGIAVPAKEKDSGLLL